MSIKTKLGRIYFKMRGVPSCAEIEALAYDFLEGRLDAKTTAAIEKHMKLCPPCLPFLESYRRIKEMGGKDAPPSLDPEFKAHLKKLFCKLP